ncbi:MAG TPA: hypothetical protein VGO00_15485 [Kofleriaceae bacterium]|nr:hypothetical protein [Kofleriaceae bacterium]
MLSVVGCVLVGAFFLAWLDFGGERVSGAWLAWDQKQWLFLVPLSGLALAVAAAKQSSYTRLAAVVAGLLVAGDVTWSFLRDVVLGSGADMLLIFGGSAAVLLGASDKRRNLRWIGGAAALAGFFAPWDHDSLFRVLLSGAFGHMSVLWLIPVAGVTAITSSASSSVANRRLAIASGAIIGGSVLWSIGSAANSVLAWGAWLTLGASTVALVFGVLAPGIGATPARREINAA